MFKKFLIMLAKREYYCPGCHKTACYRKICEDCNLEYRERK